MKRVPFTLVALTFIGAAIGYWFKGELASSKIDGLEQLVANLQARVPPPTPPISSPPLVFPYGIGAALSSVFVILVLLAWRNGRKVTSLRSDLATGEARLNEVAQQLAVAERREPETPEITVFLHDRGDSDFAKKVRSQFEIAGWRVAVGRTDLPQHAIGVRLLGGSQRNGLVARWALARLGITPIRDGEQRVPGLQVVIGEAQPITIDDAREQTIQMKAERDAALVALKDHKHKYAMEVLEACSKLRWKERGNVKPHVTVRFAAYGDDYQIAEKVKGILTQYVGWDVKIDGGNVPALPQAKEYKVIFDFAQTYLTYQPLFGAFQEGALLGEEITVAWVNTDRDDSEHVIVRVLPSG